MTRRKPDPDEVALYYVGPGWLPGIPARDLTAADLASIPNIPTADALIASGLYAVEPATPPAAEDSTHE